MIPIPARMVALLLLGGCAGTTHVALLTGDQAVLGPGGSLRLHSGGLYLLLERPGRDDPIQVVVFDGEGLLGVKGLELFDLDLGGEATSDHPSLGRWQEEHARLEQLAEDANESPAAIATLALDLPFEILAVAPLLRYTEHHPGAVAQLLDRLFEQRSGPTVAVPVALRAAKLPDLDDERLAAWLEDDAISGSAAVATAMLASPAAGPLLRRRVMEEIARFPGNKRRALYVHAGRELAGEPEHAGLLADALDRLLMSDRDDAVLAILGRASEDLLRSILADMDRFFLRDRARVLASILAGKGFSGPVQTAVIRATGDLFLTDRRRLRHRIAKDQRLEPEAQEILRQTSEK